MPSDWEHRGLPAEQLALEALPGESDMSLDELPPEANAADCVAIIEDVHQEAVAAVMAQGDLPRGHYIRGYGTDLPPRPRSGPVTSTGRPDRS